MAIVQKILTQTLGDGSKDSFMAEIKTQLERADKGLEDLFSSPFEESIFTYLPQFSIDAIEANFGMSVHDIQRIVVSPPDASLHTTTHISPASVLEVAFMANPCRYFSHDASDGFAKDPLVPGGHILPFAKDPSPLGLPAQDAVDIPIAFDGFGARGWQHRSPGQHGTTFFRRSDTLRALNHNKVNKRENAVHVFVVDQGMDAAYVNRLGGAGTYGELVWEEVIVEFPSLPPINLFPVPNPSELPIEQRHRHRSMPQWHAHMIVRNILSVAGDNRDLNGGKPIVFYDVPVLPDRVGSVLGTAAALYFQMFAILNKATSLMLADPNARVVIVNAWSVKNRLNEETLGGVTTTPTHFLNTAINILANHQHIAVVFAAGNAGQFTTDPEAGPYDRGPGRSIWLPNATNGAISVGAGDATGLWIGSSSQGPSGWVGASSQPRFAAPSFFREDFDAHVSNTGTSSSCAVVAGLVAKRWRSDPTPLKIAAAQSGSLGQGQLNPDTRLGHGILKDKLL